MDEIKKTQDKMKKLGKEVADPSKVFSDSLFAENQSLTLINSPLTILNNVFMLLYSKRSVSSACIIGTNTFEELGRSCTYNKNNNSASIEPCGTPLLISFLTVSADSVIFIYCFLPFK